MKNKQENRGILTAKTVHIAVWFKPITFDAKSTILVILFLKLYRTNLYSRQLYATHLSTVRRRLLDEDDPYEIANLA